MGPFVQNAWDLEFSGCGAIPLVGAQCLKYSLRLKIYKKNNFTLKAEVC